MGVRPGETEVTKGDFAALPTVAPTKMPSSENARYAKRAAVTAHSAAITRIFCFNCTAFIMARMEKGYYSPPFSPCFIEAMSSAFSFSRDFGTMIAK